MVFQDLKQEIYGAYEFLGEWSAPQNEIDINLWFESGLITKSELQ